MRVFLFVGLLIIASSSCAQDTTRLIEARAGYGFLIAHRSNMRHLLTGHASMFELSVKSRMNRNDHMSTVYPGTETGLTLSFIAPGNKESIGFGLGVYPNIRLKLGPKKHSPKLKLGAGAGWIQKPFHQDNNNQNIAIGSYINALINISLEDEFRLKSSLIKYGISFSHFSNAAFSAPNLGLNIPTLYIGYSYIYKEASSKEQVAKEAFDLGNYSWMRNHEVLGSMGTREVSLHHTKKYMVGALGYQYLHQFSNKLAWSAGADLFYNPSLSAESDAPASGAVNMQMGTYIGLEVLFNNNSLYVQQGVYVFSPYKGNGIRYNRIGYRNRLKNGMILGVGLKTHLTVAEYIEVNFGYILKKGRKKNQTLPEQ